MYEIRTRMKSLHHMLTGQMAQPTWRCTYPRQHLWGNTGQPERTPRGPRRSLPARLLRWGGSGL